MFIGGTNFGFMNGRGDNGNKVTTNYDYDGQLNEAGNYTPKYYKTRELYQKLVASGRFPKIHLPEIPHGPSVVAYDKASIEEVLPFEEILTHAQKFVLKKPVSMELLDIGKDYGQRFGFIMYRVEGKEAKTYEVTGMYSFIQYEIKICLPGSKVTVEYILVNRPLKVNFSLLH